MTSQFAIEVLDTLRGEMLPGYAVPNVENIYEEGKPYYQCYDDVFHAYERLRERLNVIDEDDDVEIIIHSFFKMERLIAEKMFFYGAHFALEEFYRKQHPEYYD
jgi:hypothetical protein